MMGRRGGRRGRGSGGMFGVRLRGWIRRGGWRRLEGEGEGEDVGVGVDEDVE